MTEQETFEHLFEVAKTSKDTRGVVAAALVERGKILVSCPSSHDGVEHAEYRVLQEAAKRGIRIHNQHFLFVTVVPCGKRNPKGKGAILGDCTTNIIRAGIQQVVYGIPDPDASSGVEERFVSAGVTLSQINDKEIIKRTLKLFNNTCKIPRIE